MGSQGAAVRLTGFTRRYGPQTSVGPLDLTVEAGTCHGLVGANGAGKSTILRCLLGLDEADEGDVLVLDRTPALGIPVSTAAGMIEEPAFFWWLDGPGNLRAAFPDRQITAGAIASVLAEVGLAEVEKLVVRKYSQGMRQRLGIARVLLAEPELVVLDEPTNGLDPFGIRWFRGLVSRLTAEGRTVLFSSHLLHEVQSACQGFTMIDHGAVVAEGQTKDIHGYASLEDLYLSIAGGGKQADST